MIILLIAIPLLGVIALFLYCAFSCFSAAGCCDLVHENESNKAAQLLLDYEIAEDLGVPKEVLAAIESDIAAARKDTDNEEVRAVVDVRRD